MKVSTVAALLCSSANGISLKNTPPVNEIYEAVLRNKFDNRDNMEKILLELSDLQDTYDAVDEKQADILSKLKTNVEELKASFEETSKSLNTLEDNKGNLSENIEEIRTKFSDRIQKLSDSMAQSTLDWSERNNRIESDLSTLETEFYSEITKTRQRENDIIQKLDSLQSIQDDFMTTTKSRLFELSELESNTKSVLERIETNDFENSKKIVFIEDFRASTDQKINGQDNEIKMLTKMIKSLQNKLSVDEFKEERMTEKLKAASLETIQKINSLKDEIDLIRQKSSESPDSNEIIESEIKSLEKELIEIEGFLMFQQFDMDKINRNNKAEVASLKRTDFDLVNKLTKVETNIHRIGTDVLYATKMMKMVPYSQLKSFKP